MVVHVRARAVPLSLNRNVSFCPSTGDPEGAAIVAAAANAVTLYWFVLPAVGVIVLAEVVAAVVGRTSPNVCAAVHA